MFETGAASPAETSMMVFCSYCRGAGTVLRVFLALMYTWNLALTYEWDSGQRKRRPAMSYEYRDNMRDTCTSSPFVFWDVPWGLLRTDPVH